MAPPIQTTLQLSCEFYPAGVDLLLPSAPPPVVALKLVEVEVEGASTVTAEAQDVSIAVAQPLEDIGVEDLVIG